MVGLEKDSRMLEAIIHGIAEIYVDKDEVFPAIILRDSKERFLPILIGYVEAASIANAIEGRRNPAPNTHDLMMNILRSINGKVVRVVISELHGDRFKAQLIINMNEEAISVESRPSDAIALAVRERPPAPIYVTEEVMNEAGVSEESLIRDSETINNEEWN